MKALSVTCNIPDAVNYRSWITLALCAALLAWPAVAQRRVDPRNLQERIIAIVPIVGAGTYADPKRPLFAPRAGESRSDNEETIHTFSYEVSDDGRYAIAEFVARDRKAFASILADSRVVKAFIKGQHKRDDIEREVKRYKKDFSLAPQERGRQ